MFVCLFVCMYVTLQKIERRRGLWYVLLPFRLRVCFRFGRNAGYMFMSRHFSLSYIYIYVEIRIGDWEREQGRVLLFSVVTWTL